MKNIIYLLQALLLHLLMFFLKLLPLDTASNFGGWVGRTVGPRLGASRKAMKHLQQALPDLSEERRREIITEMWDNLGRVMAEYPHLEQIGRERVELIAPEIMEQLKNDGKPAILFTGHLGNWECASPYFLHHGLLVSPVYRAPNNPWVRGLLNKARSIKGQLPAYSKSKAGTRQLIKALKEGRHVGILIDQKYNEGIAVNFFGHKAMSSPAFVQLAQKFDCPLVPARMERLGGAHFRVSLYEPLTLTTHDGLPLPHENVIETAHSYLEDWIREKPGQWLWLHRRWSSKKLEEYKDAA